jgi:SSS family solute:Na+ symporter
MNLGPVDWGVIGLYLAFVLGIGVIASQRAKSGNDFFLAGRAIPAWVCGLAFISANLGAQEVIGMGASGAKYGMSTAHFYWVGAIPAMVFVGVFMMPFYYGSKARSAPEYLRLRFDEKTRALNAIIFAAMTILNSGISMYALAKLIQTLRVFDGPVAAMGLSPAWVFHGAIITAGAVVLLYIQWAD